MSLIETIGTFNFRDFGGYESRSGGVVRSGILLRSASPDRINVAEAKILQTKLSLKTIIDLRHPEELNDNPTLGALVEIVGNRENISVINSEKDLRVQQDELDTIFGIGQSGSRYMAHLERGKDLWRQVFELYMESSSYPILVHCTAGKDRTGIVAGLILDLANVEKEVIVADYTVSSDSVDRLMDYLDHSGRFPKGSRAELRDRMLSPSLYMEEFLNLLYKKYGNAEGYLKFLGFSQTEIIGLRDYLVN